MRRSRCHIIVAMAALAMLATFSFAWSQVPGQVALAPVPGNRVAAADENKAEPQKKAEPEKKADKKDLDRTPDVIFVPTPQEAVDKMLELAKVTKDDVVYDLGCGNGIIVVTAAKKYGCKCVGFDIDPQRIKDSNENVKKNKVEDLVEIKRDDIFTLDLSKANVITLYLQPELNVKLMPQLEKMKPGSRIVSHEHDMNGARPDRVIKVRAGGRERMVYLWTIPLKKEKK
jgi:SAM-dependent methyltransferase